MKNCIKCKAELPDEALYCMACGKKQTATVRRKARKRPNGTGSIVKLKGNRARPWRAVKRGIIIGHYATEREAADALARLVDVDITEKYDYTFKQVFEAWKKEHYASVSKKTQGGYDRAFALSEELHDRKFRSLRTGDFQAILTANENKSENTISKYKQLFTQMGRWAVKNDVCAQNYAAFAEISGKEAKPHQPLTAEEIALIEADGSETARVVLMMLSTGVRIGEMFAIRLEDYFGSYIVGGEKSEEGRDRIIPIRPEGREHFEYFAQRARASGGQRIIDGYSGNRDTRNFRERDYKPLLKRLGIDASKTPHSTRTTYGTRAATEDQLAPAVLQKVMGHASFDTTQKYYNKPSADALVKAVEDSSSGDKSESA